MPSSLRSFTRCTAAALLALGLATPAFAVAYDAPTVNLVRTGLWELTLTVKAGPSGAPAGFVVEWMKKSDYDRIGGWPVDYDPSLIYCAFVGEPTLNLWGASTFLLGPSEEATVQPGDLFDETGIVTNYVYELPPGTAFAVRAHVEGDVNGEESAYSSTVFATTSGTAECTQGFWKNHPELWPPDCTPMLLGTTAYTKEQLLDILNTPANGNGLISLAHQLIAAKLNICNGSSGAPLGTTIADADALIDGQVIPGGYLAPASTSDLTETLDQYNNGNLGGVINCPTAVHSNATWGKLKALYR